MYYLYYIGHNTVMWHSGAVVNTEERFWVQTGISLISANSSLSALWVWSAGICYTATNQAATNQLTNQIIESG